jgi:hypothetical protein
MLRISAVTIALLVVAGPAALAQLPAQPPPVQGMSINAGSEQERAACHPDVMRWCKSFVHDNGQDDVFGILNCLQSNRSKISGACQQVLASHGQ